MRLTALLKTCRDCGKLKPYDSFYTKAGSTVKRSYCAACHANRNRAYAKQLSGRLKAKREAELGPARCCAICGTSTRRLCWDHDHGNNKARGWLCYACNTAIGKLGDSPEILEAAASYLRERGCSPFKYKL